MGSGSFFLGDEIFVRAVANTGFYFVNWSKDSSLESEEAEFYYVMPDEDVVLVANFNEHELFEHYELDFSHYVHDLFFVDDFIYVASESGFHIFYVDGYELDSISSFEIGEVRSIEFLELDDSNFILAFSQDGLFVYDVSDSFNPGEVFEDYSFEETVSSEVLFQNGEYFMYVGSSSKIVSVHIENQESFEKLESYEFQHVSGMQKKEIDGVDILFVSHEDSLSMFRIEEQLYFIEQISVDSEISDFDIIEIDNTFFLFVGAEDYIRIFVIDNFEFYLIIEDFFERAILSLETFFINNKPLGIVGLDDGFVLLDLEGGEPIIIKEYDDFLIWNSLKFVEDNYFVFSSEGLVLIEFFDEYFI